MKKEWIYAPRPIPPYLASFDLFPDKSIFENKGEPLEQNLAERVVKALEKYTPTQDEEKE